MSGSTRAEGARTGEQRLFVALLLPQDWLRSLSSAQQALRDAGLRLRYTRPEGIHLTLHFLGATPRTRAAGLDHALRQAASAARPFTLRLGAAGTFGSGQRPRVVWLGVEDSGDRLQALQRALAGELRAAGFPVEGRPFRPHLTLARVPEAFDADAAARLAGAVAALRVPPVEPLEGRQFCLMESHLRPTGARYEQLAAYALGSRLGQSGGEDNA